MEIVFNAQQNLIQLMENAFSFAQSKLKSNKQKKKPNASFLLKKWIMENVKLLDV